MMGLRCLERNDLLRNKNGTMRRGTIVSVGKALKGAILIRCAKFVV